jgi:nucleotide-binding universal stress UspA family protein
VVHAWWLPGETQLQTGQVQLPPGRLEELLQAKQESHARALQDLLRDYRMTLDAPQVHFAKGSPAPLIAQVAAALPADLIVLGTVGRTGIPGFFIGNTAESVIQSSMAPVLTVKPAGFRSPVVA